VPLQFIGHPSQQVSMLPNQVSLLQVPSVSMFRTRHPEAPPLPHCPPGAHRSRINVPHNGAYLHGYQLSAQYWKPHCVQPQELIPHPHSSHPSH
jgi:hypothetical protein